MIPRKINIGCGFDKRQDYLNIDSDPLCDPDILIVNNDLSRLPQAYFDEALALDVLEHIPRTFTASALFDWGLLLRPGGRLFVETSFIYGIIDVMRRSDSFETAHNWGRCLFGNQVHAGDFHFNGFTHKTLRTYLRAAGFAPEALQLREDWLIFGWAEKVEDWSRFLNMESYQDFVVTGTEELLGRSPEDWRLEARPTPANSPERLAEIKVLACADERLYMLGKTDTENDAMEDGTPVAQPVRATAA
jgi:hypothetical protein